LRGSGGTARIASRHPRRAEGDSLEQIAANAHDERSVETNKASPAEHRYAGLFLDPSSDPARRSLIDPSSAVRTASGRWQPQLAAQGGSFFVISEPGWAATQELRELVRRYQARSIYAETLAN
jgi:hypothetical protein